MHRSAFTSILHLVYLWSLWRGGLNLSIGCAIAGTGMISRVHADAITAIEGAELRAVWGRDPNRTREFASRYGAEPFASYDEMLSRAKVQVVNICTPSGTHADLGIRAASAGKHVLVEKPIEIALDKADALIASCKRSNVKLGVIFQSRFLPEVLRLKKAVDDGVFGKLILGDAYVKWYRAPEYYAAGSWHGTLSLDGGGALMNQAIHTVDLLRWLMGPVESAFAFKGALRYPHIEAEDTLVANVKFSNGALGVIEAATSIRPGFKRRLEISGERGTAVLDGDNITVWEFEGQHGATGRGESVTDGSSNPASIATEGHRLQIDDFVKAIEENREPAVSGIEGRKSLELVEAIYASAREGRVVRL
jgi:UDP-N-acetyl-2-amino-2-deoxyglucuronate dehydrogenase